MKYFIGIFFLTTICFSQSHNNKHIYSELELDSIISSKISNNFWIFAFGASLVAIDSDFEQGMGYIGAPILGYSLAVGTNSIYFENGYVFKGIYKSLFKTVLTAASSIMVAVALSLSNSDSFTNVTSGGQKPYIIAGLAALAANIYISYTELKDFKQTYFEDNKSLSILPNMDYKRQSYSITLNYTF